MIVTKLELQNPGKIKVFIDEEYAFFLEEKDMELYILKEGDEIGSEMFHEITEKLLWERSKQKAVNLLKFADRSEQELRSRLSEAGFHDSIIDRTIAYVRQYGYLDDARYAANYIRTRMNRKSKLVIKGELVQKGIKKDLIDGIIEQEYGEDEDAELQAIKKIIEKKTKSAEDLTPEKKEKLIASLYRKGFEIGKIKQLIN